MRKVFINKWFFLGAAFTLSLSLLSLIAYKKTQPICSVATECCQNTASEPNQNTDMLWDVLSRQFAHFISIQ